MLNLNETAKKIGRNISNLLIERDKTQQELADAIGVSKSTVSTWTHGKRIPRMDKVDLMCKYFNVERSAIIGDSQTRYRSNPRKMLILSAIRGFFFARKIGKCSKNVAK